MVLTEQQSAEPLSVEPHTGSLQLSESQSGVSQSSVPKLGGSQSSGLRLGGSLPPDIMLTEPQLIDPDHLTCGHYVIRKKRRCRLQPLKHSCYCAEHVTHHVTNQDDHVTDQGDHVSQQRRIPCPMDPAHFILQSKLSKHLKVCNANKFVYTSEPYYKEDVNIPPRPDNDVDSISRQPLSALPLQDLIDTCIALARYGAISRVCDVSKEDGVSEEDKEFYRPLSKSEGELGSTAYKHAVQQIALVNTFRTFLSNQTQESSMSGNCFVELGAGKGSLSQWFDFRESGNFFVLVDRQICRWKADAYFKKEKSNFIRLKMDIKDMDIPGLSEVEKYKQVCIACKHLCGGATDLALVAATRVAHLKPTCVLIALCCHHLCSWETFSGKNYFLKHFQLAQFYTLSSMTAWATCFKLDSIVTDDRDYISKEVEKFLDNAEQFVENGHLILNKSLQWYLGRCAKMVLNDARAAFMKDEGFRVKFVTYVGVNISPENTALLCYKDKTE